MSDIDKDLASHLADTDREVGERPAQVRTVVLRRSYNASVEDVWDAVTTPERIGRWLTPVTGDLRLGGRYQLEGNAGGEITRCEPPHLLTVTWIFGEQTEGTISEVEVRISAAADGNAILELEHAATVDPNLWGIFGPGAVGVGWDLGLLGLAMHLRGGDMSAAEKEAWGTSAEARAFMTSSSEAWGAALAATGVDAETVASAVKATTKFYAPDPDAGSDAA